MWARVSDRCTRGSIGKYKGESVQYAMGNRRLLVASVVAALTLGLNLFTAEPAFGAKKKPSPSKTAKSAKKAPAKGRSAKNAKSARRTAKKPAAKSGKVSAKDRKRARWAARAAAEARRREAARLAAIRRFDDSLRKTAYHNISIDNSANEDRSVRHAAVAALGSRAGTVVVMDPNNGRVLSIVNQKMAIGAAIKPCSTIKPVIALAALAEKLMPESDTRILRACNCEMDMDDALAYSNNEYFQQLGRQLGLAKITRYARTFGFGERTGINLPGEVAGALPEDISDGGIGRVASHGDGIGITAIQLASFVSAVANGGSLYQPQVVAPGKSFTPILRRQIAIDPKDRRAVLDGMSDAVSYGTARRAQSAFEDVAGKTGTCIGQGSWVGLFASFADVENPNLVVVVITRGSSSRGKFAADIAGDVYRSLSARFGNQASRPRRVGDDETPTISNQTVRQH